jgi:hypothetical protein
LTGTPLQISTLKLEFKAELASEGFTDRLMESLALNRQREFYVHRRGRGKSKSLSNLNDCASPWNSRPIHPITLSHSLVEVDPTRDPAG